MKTAKGARAKKSKSEKLKKNKKVSYHKQPDNLQLEAWQFVLRKQFGEESPFKIENIGTEPVFSEFRVLNPETGNEYEVAIRNGETRYGHVPGSDLYHTANLCTCQDFKTNRLGICKHISAVLNFLGKKRGNKKLLKQSFQAANTWIYLDYRNGREVRIAIGKKSSAEYERWAAAYFDSDGCMKSGAFSVFNKIILEGKKIDNDFICRPDAFEFILQQREEIGRRKRIHKAIPEGAADEYFDQLLPNIKLYLYQRQGILFAARAGRCLIADEMGLGKTIQALGAAELYRKEIGIQKVLIVCPTSLKYQWKSEIKKFTGQDAAVVEGMQTKRWKQYEDSESFYHILSYNVATNDVAALNKMDADLVILDEAQRIKNFRTKVATQLKKIYTPYSIVLTGTPLENKLEELYSIVQFIDQYKLPPLYRFLDRYQVLDEGRVVGYKNLKEISETLGQCMVRRTKKEVLKQLPKRMDKFLFVPMTKEQSDIHKELADTVARLVAKWRRYHYLSETDRRILILSLSQMRMVCDSTFILDQKTRFDTKVDELMFILEEALTNPDQKVVIFSQWERMTRIVAEELDAREVSYAWLHGGVDSKGRGHLIDRFREDPDCKIFLSTDAGGIGLNLQGASLLINLDIPWNPAVLEQRIGRIFRIGQKNNITVVNMVAVQSIEHRMLSVLAFKSEMAKGVLDPEGEDSIFMSETKLRKFMENVESLSAPVELEEAEPSGIHSNMETGEEDLEVEEIVPPGESKIQQAPEKETYTGDDDVETAEPSPAETVEKPGKMPQNPEPATGAGLAQAGISFFSGLINTLGSAEKTKELVESLVQKDEKSGETYLKIPVESKEVVENALNLFKNLASAFAGR